MYILHDSRLGRWLLKMEVAEEDRHKTAFCDATGKLWEYVRCGFGLKNLPAAFHTVVSQALGLPRKRVKSWLDDIIIASKTFQEHMA